MPTGAAASRCCWTAWCPRPGAGGRPPVVRPVRPAGPGVAGGAPGDRGAPSGRVPRDRRGPGPRAPSGPVGADPRRGQAGDGRQGPDRAGDPPAPPGREEGAGGGESPGRYLASTVGRDEVVRINREAGGVSGPSVGDGPERRFPTQRLEVPGEVVGRDEGLRTGGGALAGPVRGGRRARSPPGACGSSAPPDRSSGVAGLRCQATLRTDPLATLGTDRVRLPRSSAWSPGALG